MSPGTAPGAGTGVLSSRRVAVAPRGHGEGGTHRSTFGTGEPHHAGLASGSGGTRGTGAPVLTSGTLSGGASAPSAAPAASRGTRGHRRGQLTGGPVLPSGPGLPGLPVRPCGTAGGASGAQESQGMLQGTGASWKAAPPPARRAGQAVAPCHRVVTVSPRHRARSPWHRGVRVPRAVQLHQEILWGQRGRGSRARRGDPGERGQG